MINELQLGMNNPLGVIETFQQDSDRLLKHSTPVAILKAVAAVTITAVATLIAAAIGFGLGFVGGLWMGPAAFYTAVMTAEAAATATIAASATIGLGFGALSGQRFFKPSAAAIAANNVVEQAAQDYPVCA